MKSFYKTTLFLLFTLAPLVIFAQQGVIAAGGDAVGAGGNMSYSIGQVDYMAYTSLQGNLNMGIQQSWLAVPMVLEIPDIIVTSGNNLCFDAAETVIIAGENKHFIIETGAHADIIAGNNILLKEGTSVNYGGSFHAFISDLWCDYHNSILATKNDNLIIDEQNLIIKSESSFFTVYPNPTTGDFTLELLNFLEEDNIVVEIFNIQGNLIFRKEMPCKKQYDLSLAEKQSGFYLIRIQTKYEAGISKIIKQ